MKRRDFLQTGSVISLPILLNGLGVSAITKSSLFSHFNVDNDKILILIYLAGGNDGLNTLIPIDQYEALQEVRPDVILPESSLLTIEDNNAFHGALTGFKNLYTEEKLGIIQGVAYPNQNRSHFRSTDIWNSGSDAQTYVNTGWLGRYLEVDHPGYPMGYPNGDYPDPLAVTMDYALSETCQGSINNFSLALADPNSIGSVPESIQGTITNDCFGNELSFIIDSIEQSNKYSERMLEVYGQGTNMSTKYPDNNRLAQQLKTVAKMISGGSGTKIYVINQRGYDTHAGQVVSSDTTTGSHADLLKTLSDAVEAFQDDIDLLGYGERVLGMTYSEFGRRVKSNQSAGTDHGTAAPMFLFGQCVEGGILGNNPEVTTNIDSSSGVEMQYDFKSVYGSVLIDWFGVEQETIGDIFSFDFQYLPIVQSCTAPVSTKEVPNINALSFYPNPVSAMGQIKVDLEKDSYSLKIYDVLGKEIKTVFTRTLGNGEHEIAVDCSDLVAGQYVLRLAGSSKSFTKRFVKI